MQGVGPGTVLAGRYDLSRRLSQRPDLERWSAHDTTLEREVTLTIVGPEHPNRAGVLDAARRAAGVEDTRLVRILDVGTQHDNSFIVEEALSESESLATILLQGPLPAEEARRIAGETARGLEAAGQRGLHHLRLTPHYVMIASDGTVRVGGVAVAAAIDGPDEQEPDAATASRRDAIALVALVYAALTSRWPLDQEIPDVEPTPRAPDGAVAPAEIAAGVPGDLDALCRMTLNEDTGPSSPEDFANRIGPWPRERVLRAQVEPTVALQLPGTGGSAGNHDVTEQGPPNAGMAAPTVAVSGHDVAAPAAPTAADKAAAAGAATTKAFGAALAGAGAAAGAVGDKLGSLGRSSNDKDAAGDPDHQTQRMTLPAGLSSQGDDVEQPLTPLPMLPASTAQPPSRGQSKIVVLVVASFVALALFVGYKGLVGPGDVTLSTPAPRRSAAASPPPATAPAAPSPKAGATAAGPIAILSSTGFDPEGDKSEGNSRAAKVYDGDLATSWTSEQYSTAQFGNLKKGVGVLLDLGQPTSVHEVTLTLGSQPADVTVYAATGQSLEGATVIGKASAASGQVKVKAGSTMPEAQSVIVWFTSLPQDGGQFRASISEIALS